MKCFLALALAGVATATALAQVGSGGTISDGPTLFRQADSPTSATGIPPIGGELRDGGGTNPDHLFQVWWWVRTNNVDTREFALANATAWDWTGNVGTQNFTNANWTAIARYTVTDKPAPEGGVVRCDLILTNPTASERSYALFHYLDVDILGAGAAGSDGAELVSPNLMRIFDEGPDNAVHYLGDEAAAFQVTSFSTLRGLLTNTTINNLANTGLPFAPADFTGAYQWNITVPAGETVTVAAYVGLNSIPSADLPPCPGDVDGDQDVDLTDLAFLLTNFGLPSGAEREDGDLDGDGDVDLTDLATLLSLFGTACT
ncbi:MAG: dockerin type I domain-containing protein [Phycisphaerae bacterium]